MASLGKTILVLVLMVCLSGCTFHFKGKDVEISSERQRVQMDETYQLEKIELLRG